MAKKKDNDDVSDVTPEIDPALEKQREEARAQAEQRKRAVEANSHRGTTVRKPAYQVDTPEKP